MEGLTTASAALEQRPAALDTATPVAPAPAPAVPLDRILAHVAADAACDAGTYLRETHVPGGGE